jgi:hypothetical protein
MFVVLQSSIGSSLSSNVFDGDVNVPVCEECLDDIECTVQCGQGQNCSAFFFPCINVYLRMLQQRSHSYGVVKCSCNEERRASIVTNMINFDVPAFEKLCENIDLAASGRGMKCRKVAGFWMLQISTHF